MPNQAYCIPWQLPSNYSRILPGAACSTCSGRASDPWGELVERLEMTQPAVSKQLRVLREAGLASVRVDAQRRIYRLRPDGLREVDEWLAPYRAFWEGRLDGRLGAAIHVSARRRRGVVGGGVPGRGPDGGSPPAP